MVLLAFLISTITLVVSSASFKPCYFNETYGQCPPGEKCGIVPPLNSTVRRRTFHQEREQSVSRASWFNFGERRRGKGGGKGGGRSGSRSSRRSTRSTRSSRSSGSNSWRYSNSISQSSYGTTTRGFTSIPATFAVYGLWSSRPERYHRYRKNTKNVDNLRLNQGVCTNSTELRPMTEQDCYNWCMSDKYDDNECAKDCGLAKKEKGKKKGGFKLTNTLTALVVGAVLFVCVCFLFILRSCCVVYKNKNNRSL